MSKTVAYFSMEVAHANEMPNYAGGLGVLAADTIMSAADLGVDMVGISLLYHLNDDLDDGFRGERYMIRLPETVEVEIEDRKVQVAIWKKEIIGRGGKIVPVLFLSTHHPDNPVWDRDITKHIYAPEPYFRLAQEAVLGVGGVRALEILGYDVGTYHLNEGHAALATLELLRRNQFDEPKVRSLVTFTTHTPIPAGHDYFDYDLAGKILRDLIPWDIRDLAGRERFGMTQLAMSLSKSTNSVSKRHQKVCEEMFPGAQIKNVTNGIYAPRWAGDHMTELFNTCLPGWDEDPSLFSQAVQVLPHEDLWRARSKEKGDLVRWINFNKSFFSITNISDEDMFDEGTLTIGFGRRTVPYKRTDLIFKDIERLGSAGRSKLQLIFANRCHAGDGYCNDLRERLREYAEKLRGSVKIVLIPDYDLKIAKRLVSGCDVWLNTPIPPLEASGTSGMKAALNGCLNLSMRDGWWIEGLEREPMSGWGFGGERYGSEEEQNTKDASALMDALDDVADCYYVRKEEWNERMRHAIALLSYFNTSRLVREYQEAIWEIQQ